MQIILKGTTRITVLIGNVAVKIPHLLNGWELFLQGLLANCQERKFSKTGWLELCPIVCGLPGGWCNVMWRAKPLTDRQWNEFDFDLFVANTNGGILAENKRDSFGVLDGKIVVVDYG